MTPTATTLPPHVLAIDDDAAMRELIAEYLGACVTERDLKGDIKWEHKVLTPPWGGVMSTAGNLVFGGTQEGVVFALDARTGERLWYFAGNDRVYASPISYLSNGKQFGGKFRGLPGGTKHSN